jgi:arylsulfatase
MQQDPSQTTNVVDQHAEVVAEMRAAYDTWWKATRALMVNEDAPMSPTRPFHELYRKQIESGGIPNWEVPAL